ncbi:cytoplasmic aconitate hydratase-like isoform X1, partial [Aphis craccivora]
MRVSWTKLALGEIKQRFLPSSPDVFNKVPMNPYERFKKTINVSNKNYTFFDLPKFGDEYNQLPFSIRVLLESAVRNCDNFQITENDVQNILKWKTNQTIEGGVEVAFKPARVILQ